MFLNLLLAFSNIAAIPPLVISQGYDTLFVFCPMVVSFFYHLAETKHELPGIYPFNQYAYPLLMVDRIVAYSTAIWFFRRFLQGYKFYHFNDVPYLAMGGLVFMLISECPGVPQHVFVVCHLVWHFVAYITMCALILKE